MSPGGATIYLDNQATTPTDRRVLESMLPFLEAGGVGKPSEQRGASEWDESPQDLRPSIGGPQPTRNLSLRRLQTRAERETSEYLDWYNNIYRKLPPDEQKKIGEEIRRSMSAHAPSGAIARTVCERRGSLLLPSCFRH